MVSKGSYRGQLSSVDVLPEDLRVKLNMALREKRLTQEEIRESINTLLEDRGGKPISRSSFNRYAVRMEKQGAMMREAREAADAIVGGLGEQKGTDLGRAVAEMIKTLTFDRVMKESGEIDVDDLNKLALISQRIERASKISLEREQQLREHARQQALEEAAETVKETAIELGMDEEHIQFWRQRVLGIK